MNDDPGIKGEASIEGEARIKGQARSEGAARIKVDPRIRRTRRRLHDALIELTIARGYDAVTVQDVLTHAQTARSTFYAHFRDKDDLLLSGFQDRGGISVHGGAIGADQPMPAQHMPDQHMPADPMLDDPYARFAHALFAHVHEHRALAVAHSGTSSGALMRGHLRNVIVVEARRLVARHPLAQQGDGELAVQFVAGTVFNLLSWWIDHDFPASVDDMARACHRFVSGGLAAWPAH